MMPQYKKVKQQKITGLRRFKSNEKTKKFLSSEFPQKQHLDLINNEKCQVFQKNSPQKQPLLKSSTALIPCEKDICRSYDTEHKLTRKLNFQKNVKNKRQKDMEDFMVKIQEMKKFMTVDPNTERDSHKAISNAKMQISPKKLKKAFSIQSASPQLATPRKMQAPLEVYSHQKQLQQTHQDQVLHPVRHNYKYAETTSTSSTRKSVREHKITDFDFLKKIGNGKFGEVYLAQHKASKILVALKKIKKSELDEKLKTQLIHQIKIQFFMNHPNIVKLYAYFSDEENVYLVMELALSGHLYSLVCDKPSQCLDQNTVKIIVKQLCQGVSNLHNNGIIHRDLKLQNVLYQMGMIKICDFGWAIETKILRETFCGTPLYFSPEILRQKGYNAKVDIWSLGVLTYQLLNGTVPFEICEEKDFSKIMFDDVMFPKSYRHSHASKVFIKACLNKNPNQRPTADQLLGYQFLKFENLESIQIF